MKKNLWLLTLICASYCPAFTQSYFYWYQDQQIELIPDSSGLYVQSNDFKNLSPDQLFSMISQRYASEANSIIRYPDGGVLVVSKDSGTSAVTGYSVIKGSYQAPVLRCQGRQLVVIPEIAIAVRPGHSINEILKLFGDQIAIKEISDRGTVIVKCLVNDFTSLLSVTNKMHDLKDIVQWAEPEFYNGYSLSTTDPLYTNQYNLKNIGLNGGTAGIDINFEPATYITQGCNTVRVAVIDDGVEAHPEFLAATVATGHNAGGVGNGAPAFPQSGHGQACAGIIAAQQNAAGIAGIAPNITIVPVNIFNVTPYPGTTEPQGATNAQIAECITWAYTNGNAGVLSCSWGGGVPSNDITSAITNARTLGRGGLGTIVVFASGNGTSSASNFGPVSFPGNVSGVVTVGAINRHGDIWYYSDRDASMDLVVPSGDINFLGDLPTIDRVGTNGYEVNDLTQRFGGTSGACPQVAAVAALMLSVNPNLTESQVKTTLQNTATDMGAAGFDNTFGFGRLNAGFAVTNSIGQTITGASDYVCSSATYSVATLPAGSVITWSVTNGLAIIGSANANPVTVSKVTNGQNTISAVITRTCGTYRLTDKIVYAGTMLFPSSTVTPAAFCDNAEAILAFNIPVGTTITAAKQLLGGVQVNMPSAGTNKYLLAVGAYTVYLTLQNSCGTVTVSHTYSKNMHCTGGGGALVAYPNPANNQITVDNGQEENSSSNNVPVSTQGLLKMIDKTGNVRLSTNTNSKTTILNTSAIPNGIYYLQWSDGETISTTTVAIQH